jgi:hypothetical protein
MRLKVPLTVATLAIAVMAHAADSGSAASAVSVYNKAGLAMRDRPDPPHGWHRPTPDELSGEPLRKNHPTQYIEAEADFDGDGKEDHAALFTADDGKSEAVFVKLSSHKPQEWMIAASMVHSRPSMNVGMGISVEAPGVKKTACGKGYWNCKTGEPSELNLKQPAISFFRFESSGSIVYWDKTKRQFLQVWTSD